MGFAPRAGNAAGTLRHVRRARFAARRPSQDNYR